jgi:SAM-dependent methyltransferase
MATPAPPDVPTLWLRAGDRQRQVLRRHLEAIAGRFRGAGWRVVTGPQPPDAPPGPLAVLEDPWSEPFPLLAQSLADAPGAVGWRAPRVNDLPAPQGWSPRRGPYTRRDYEQLTRPGRVGHARATGPPLWSGFSVAPAGAASALLERGWPPSPRDLHLVPRAFLYRYADPAGHPRHELDPYLCGSEGDLLDVGCGQGLLGERHRPRGVRVVGIEPDLQLARLARERLDLVLATTAEEGLPALRGPFETIVFADVLEHTTDPARVLRLARDLLAPRGRVVATLPNSAFAPVLRALAAGRWDPTLAGVQARDHLAPLTPGSFSELASGAGLAVEKSVPLPSPLPLGLRCWAWWAARTAGGEPAQLLYSQWIVVLRPI